MTKQELTDKLTDLQQKRLTLAAKLDQMTLQLRPLDELISLLQRMLVTLQTQDEQEKRRVQAVAEETKITTPITARGV